MATVKVLWDAYLSVNAVDYSAYLKSVKLPMSIEELDASVMGNSTTIHEPGLKSFSFEAEFLNDYTDNLLDELAFAIWDGRSKVAIVLRPSKADVIGVANPEYRFTAFISGFDPGGAHGQLAGGSLKLSNTTALTRATA